MPLEAPIVVIPSGARNLSSIHFPGANESKEGEIPRSTWNDSIKHLLCACLTEILKIKLHWPIFISKMCRL